MKPLTELLEEHPLPVPTGDKDDKGAVVIVGGPPQCPGAVLLTATAALRVGAGRAQLAVDPSVVSQLGVAVPESAVFAYDQGSSPPPDVVACIEAASVVVIGPGHRELDGVVVDAIVGQSPDDAHVVVDAGALGCAAKICTQRPIVVAPNVNEAQRMLDTTEADEGQLARRLTEELGQPVAVRGYRTVVAEGDNVWEADPAPPGLGTPGSGDVYLGVLAGLLTTDLPVVAALAWATKLHADAAQRFARTTPVGYLARDLLDELPFVFGNEVVRVPTVESKLIV